MLNWLSIAWKALPWVLVACAVVFGVWERGSADSARADLADFKTKAAQAVAAQKVADAATSAAVLAERDKSLDALQGQVNSLMEKIRNAPVTNSCGPVVRDAARGVHDILRGAGH